MKTFEEKWTAWLDGQLTGKELIEFEASLPDKAAAKLEKRDAKKLGALLKRELGAHVIANEEFFSHQLRERIARENIEHGTGGPFGAVVVERESGRLISIGMNSVRSEEHSLNSSHIEPSRMPSSA